MLFAGIAHAETKTIAKGIWKSLVKPNAKWTLQATTGDKTKKIVVETYDVRKVGAADVARLRWTLVGKTEKSDIGDSDSGKYTQVAVTDAGLYILSSDMDDAAITEALKKKPSRSDPPKAYEGTKTNKGRFLHLRAINGTDVVCAGVGPMPGAGECEDMCEGEMCVAADKGVVTLNGMWAPENDMFSQKGFEE